MRASRLIMGLSIFGASAWLAPAISDMLGTSVIYGFVTVGGLLCFLAGFVFRGGFARYKL